MIRFIKKLLGIKKMNYAELVSKGAQIVDVRSKMEFQSGHIRGSINIPVQELEHHLHKLKKNLPVITCCASGMRSATAKNILLQHGFKEVYNGGGWSSLQNKIG